MKIVLLGTAFPFRGGLAAYNERLAREFMAEGHKVIIYTFSLQYPSFLFPGTSQYSDAPTPADLTIYEKVNSINPFNWIKIGKELSKMKPDLLVVKFWLPFMGACFGTICRLVKRNKKTKIISILDNVIPHEKRLGDLWLIRYFLRSVDAFIAMSASVKKDLEQFTKKECLLRVHPIYDNFGPALPKASAIHQLQLDPAFQYILFFGFIREYKGLDLLFRAMADERLKKLPLKAIIAGEFYTDPTPYLQLIKELQIEDRVILKTDFIPDEAVKNYFCAADMVVQPYKNATQSGVTQIGYHFEKPMLVTDVGGLAEIIPHNRAGYVVAVSPKAIADALFDFYSQKREEPMVSFVREEKKKYAWAEMTKSILEFVQ